MELLECWPDGRIVLQKLSELLNALRLYGATQQRLRVGVDEEGWDGAQQRADAQRTQTVVVRVTWNKSTNSDVDVQTSKLRRDTVIQREDFFFKSLVYLWVRWAPCSQQPKWLQKQQRHLPAGPRSCWGLDSALLPRKYTMKLWLRLKKQELLTLSCVSCRSSWLNIFTVNQLSISYQVEFMQFITNTSSLVQYHIKVADFSTYRTHKTISHAGVRSSWSH